MTNYRASVVPTPSSPLSSQKHYLQYKKPLKNRWLTPRCNFKFLCYEICPSTKQ